MSKITHGEVHYAGQRYSLPVQSLEDIRDIIEGIDDLGGSHLYAVGGGGNDDTLRIWIAPGVPITLQFPHGYETPSDREDYVINHLAMAARYRLGLPLDGSQDGKASGEA